MSRGISLLELLIVLVIVGIIGALVLPGYRQYLLRINRTEAMTALMQVQGAEESFYQRHNTYTGNIFAAPPGGLAMPASIANRYRLSVAVATDGQTYIATATPAPGGAQEADEDCLAFSVDARGRRAVSGTRGARYCWK
ncbi:MAG: type IV pilin protein [Pseudomonadota bacterium]